MTELEPQSLTFARVIKVVRPMRQIGSRSHLATNARLAEDLRFDSLDRQSLACELDMEFGIEIPDDDLVSWTTLGDVIATVDRLLASKRAAA